ncbi:MAG: PaaI family thioesterase [Maribacter sp.]|nr:PaaI family thioesterase [Maribacter sp.]
MNKTLAFLKSQIGKDSSASPSPLMRWLNPSLRDVEEGKLEYSYVVREEMTNPMGIIHGGATAAIIDDAIGAAVFSLGNTHIYTTINLVIDYFGRANVGETIYAKTKIVKKGKQIINGECEVWNADKSRMIAKGQSNLIQTNIKI